MRPGEVYHFYNHANGKENLFVEERNYWFFRDKLQLYVLPVADVYSYCMMPNHFHMVGEIRPYKTLIRNFPHFKDLKPSQLELKISKAFSNLFSCYTQSFNKTYKRMGSLFIPNMKRKLIVSDRGFCNVVRYVHSNPVHHGFARSMDKWKYSSFNLFLSNKPTFINKKYVLDKFGGLDNFLKFHDFERF